MTFLDFFLNVILILSILTFLSVISIRYFPNYLTPTFLVSRYITIYSEGKDSRIFIKKGSSVLDFAIQADILTAVKIIGAKVNEKLVPISYILNNNDIVELITSKIQSPKYEWLNYANNSTTKKKLLEYLKSNNIETDTSLNIPSQLVLLRPNDDKDDDLKYKLCQSCNPIPGDDVIGIADQDNNIQIHKDNCPEIIKLTRDIESRIIKTKWKNKDVSFLIGLTILLEKPSEIESLKSILKNFDFDVKQTTFEPPFYKLIIIINTFSDIQKCLDKIDKIRGMKIIEKQIIND